MLFCCHRRRTVKAPGFLISVFNFFCASSLVYQLRVSIGNKQTEERASETNIKKKSANFVNKMNSGVGRSSGYSGRFSFATSFQRWLWYALFIEKRNDKQTSHLEGAQKRDSGKKKKKEKYVDDAYRRIDNNETSERRRMCWMCIYNRRRKERKEKRQVVVLSLFISYSSFSFRHLTFAGLDFELSPLFLPTSYSHAIESLYATHTPSTHYYNSSACVF